ncbi:lysophospholipid acyltransferase family protein [Thiohalocapsa marina]|nr:lysophospholipid acyltransferase family protein [Thiohalocapsa marina]
MRSSGLNPAVALWRALRVAEHLAAGAVVGLGVALLRRLGLRCDWLPGLVCWWHRRLCRCLALRVEARGEPAHPALLVANHVSWLDIPVLGALGEVGFLSKAEVRRWPLVGRMSLLAGTVFLRRGAHQTAAAGQQLAAVVRSGRSMVMFPEGTTTDGRRLLPFHPRLFAAALVPGAPWVQPVAIRYGDDGAPDAVAPFVGDDNLLRHLLRVLRHPGLSVRVTWLAPIDSAGRDRRGLAEAARDAIGAQLGLPPAGCQGPAPATIQAARPAQFGMMADALPSGRWRDAA